METELYSVIKSPYLTEKVSSLMGESNQYAFKVDINATKLQVKKAVEGYFSVNVEDVNIIKVKGNQNLDELIERIHKIEHMLLPEIIGLICNENKRKNQKV